MNTTYIKRPINLDRFAIKHGGHGANTPNGEFNACVMEFVAYIADEPWSDHPICVCPTITSFLVSWNDSLGDEERQLLKPYILKVMGTNHGAELALKRSYMVADWYARVFVPAWLRCANVATEQADALSALPECIDPESLHATDDFLSAARSAAWSAAGSAARSAAWSAAESAAGSAAESAAWSAARSAAWSAAGSAAWSAARSAARSAAESAAESAARSAAAEALEPTRVMLQASAFDLLDRMIALHPEEVSV